MLVPYRIGDKWGFSTLHPENNIVIPYIYDYVRPFKDLRSAVQLNQLWGLIDINGNIICGCKYEYIGDFSNGFCEVQRNGKYGFINIEGEEKIPLIYDNVLAFSEERAAVKVNEKIGFIDLQGNKVTDIIYDEVTDFSNGFASVMQNDKHGCINISGEEIIPLISDIAVAFSEGLAAVSLVNSDEPLNPTAQRFYDFLNNPGMLSGYMNKENELVLHDRVGNVYNKQLLEHSAQNHKCGYVNQNRKVIIPLIYDSVFDFHEGLACIRFNNMHGYINNTGKHIVECIYEDANDFHEGLAGVRKDGKWGYIDKEGKVTINFEFELVHYFNNGIAKVRLHKDDPRSSKCREIFITKTGEEIEFGLKIEGVFEKVYEFIHDSFSENIIAAKFDWSDIFYLRKDGYILTERKYIDAEPLKNGIALVEHRSKDDFKWGYIDSFGNEYWEENVDVVIAETTTKIENQTWSRFNLDVDCFSNGDVIPQAQSDEEWEAMSENGKPAWCYYPDKHNQNPQHGKLYNWYAATDTRGIAPDGWKVPSVEDWQKLLSNLGPRVRHRLKSKEFWNGLNDIGFNVLPSGARVGPNTIDDWEFQGDSEHEYTSWWTTTVENCLDKNGECFSVDEGNKLADFSEEEKNCGFSIRLIKNQ